MPLKRYAQLSTVHNHARHRFPYQPPHTADLASRAQILRQNQRNCFHLHRRFLDLPTRAQICRSLHDLNHVKNYVASCSNPLSLSMKYFTSATYVVLMFHFGIHLLKQRFETFKH